MRKNAGDRLAQEGDIKRVRDGKAQRVDQVFAGDAAEEREEFAGEIQVALIHDLLAHVAQVAVGDAEAVLENELKGRAGRLRDVQKNDHGCFGFGSN